RDKFNLFLYIFLFALCLFNYSIVFVFKLILGAFIFIQNRIVFFRQFKVFVFFEAQKNRQVHNVYCKKTIILDCYLRISSYMHWHLGCAVPASIDMKLTFNLLPDAALTLEPKDLKG